MKVQTEEEIPEEEGSESKEDAPKQRLEDQEIAPVEEPTEQNFDFYKSKTNWAHSEQCKPHLIITQKPFWTRVD